MRRKLRDRDLPLSLHPLGFQEAVSDLLKVKPPPEKRKRKRKSVKLRTKSK